MDQSQEILVLVNELNNRVHFLFRHVFTKLMGIRPVFTNDKEAFLNEKGAKLNYSATRIADELYIRPQGLLYQKGLRKFKVEVSHYKGMPVLFPETEQSDYPFDIFSAIFYLITRYEEYLPYSPDRHGRYQPQESIAYANHFLEEPIVEKWVEVFKDFLKERFPHFCYYIHRYHYIPTVDVDSAFSFRNKGIFYTPAFLLRDLFRGHFSQFFHRVGALTHLSRDPFDTFSYLKEKFTEKNKAPVFFFLSGSRGKYDKNISMGNNVMRRIVKDTARYAEVGLHPSYASNKKFAILEKEKLKLEQVAEMSIRKSRQHFMKLSFPQTYQALVKLGVSEDYSMGYASACGFRAGTCNAYNFYDLTRDKETELRIIPFQAMDATFKNYTHSSPEEAIAKMLELREKVKKYNGIFCLIWHNETFAPNKEGKEWRAVFERLLED